MSELRLLSLNTWGGRVFEPLMALLGDLARDGLHAFCLQEIYDAPEWIAADHPIPNVRLDLLARLREILPNYHALFAPNGSGVVIDGKVEYADLVRYGNALLVRDDIRVEDHRVHPIVTRHYPVGETASGPRTFAHTLQVAGLRIGEVSVRVGNFHGLPLPGDKLDTSARVIQSSRLLRLGPDIDVLCGDFNLDPSTASIGMLERHWRNLIREFEVPTTRSRLNPYWGTPKEQSFADYVFVSQAVTVRRVTALDAQVSDHLGLLLEAAVVAARPDPSVAFARRGG